MNMTMRPSFNRAASSLLLALLLAFTAVSGGGGGAAVQRRSQILVGGINGHGDNNDVDILCHLTSIHATLNASGDDNDNQNLHDYSFQCWIEHDGDGRRHQKYDINLPDDFVVRHGLERLQNGAAVLRLRHASMQQRRILLHPHRSSVELVSSYRSHQNNRRLRIISTTGEYTALVVRVTDVNGAAPAHSLDVMRGRILGIGPYAESVNPIWQWIACSYGQLRIVPATTSNAVVDGGLEVRTTANIAGGCVVSSWGDSDACEDEIVQAIEAATGRDINDYGFVYIALPDGGQFQSKGTDWTAYGGKGQSYMMFQKGSYNHHSTLTHESGPFGPAIAATRVGTPAMCLNAHKLHASGWLSNVSESYTPTPDDPGRTFTLIENTNAANATLLLPDLDRGVLQIDDDLFVTYNRAAGANAGVLLFQNAITVSQGDYESNHLAALIDRSDMYFYNTDYNPFNNSGTFKDHIVIKLCGRFRENDVSRAILSVYDKRYLSHSTCPNEATPPVRLVPPPTSDTATPSAVSPTASPVAGVANAEDPVYDDATAKTSKWGRQQTNIILYVFVSAGVVLVLLTCFSVACIRYHRRRLQCSAPADCDDVDELAPTEKYCARAVLPLSEGCKRQKSLNDTISDDSGSGDDGDTEVPSYPTYFEV